MRGVKGRSGTNKGQDKAFAEAVRMVINESDPITGKRKLRRLAEKLYDQAMKGEGWAMQQIADRLDGKPAQESTVTVRSELDQMDDRELRDFIRRELALSGERGATAPQSTDKVITH